MHSTVERLASKVSSVMPDEIARVHSNVEHLDSIDSRFSSRALALCEQGDTEATHAARMTLRNHLGYGNLDIAAKRAKSLSDKTGTAHSVAEVILNEAAIAYAVSSTPLPNDLPGVYTVRAALDGDAQLAIHHPELRPDIFDASFGEINRYFRSLTVAVSVLDLPATSREFTEEAHVFIAWASKQEGIETALRVALTIKSLNPKTVEAIAGMQRTTPSALHDGLI